MKRVITVSALLFAASLLMGGCSDDGTKIQGQDQVAGKAVKPINEQEKIGLSTTFIKVGKALE